MHSKKARCSLILLVFLAALGGSLRGKSQTVRQSESPKIQLFQSDSRNEKGQAKFTEGYYGNGRLYFSASSIQMVWADPSDIHYVHNHLLDYGLGRASRVVHGHVLKQVFLGSQTCLPEPGGNISHKVHFFREDRESSASAYPYMEYKELYAGIRYRIENTGEHLKTTWFISAGSDANSIGWEMQGAEKTTLESGRLLYRTSVGILSEDKPIAWQFINGKKVDVPVEFQITGNRIGFQFPKSYDNRYALIIDPSLVFSSFSGSFTDNWGFTATDDPKGQLVSGGIVFGGGFPVTPGAFQTTNLSTASGFRYDIGILKYNKDGSKLLFATYIGGSETEQPHSLICDSLGRLYIFGTTNSPNFPARGGFDTTANGAHDMYVFCLSPNGDSLISSTYIGGPGADGLNNTATLNVNYGDVFRGDITLTPWNEVVVISSTLGPGLPVTANAFQPNKSSGQDGVLFSLSTDIKQLKFCTYLGSQGADAGYSVKTMPGVGKRLVVGMSSDGILPTSTFAFEHQKPGLVDGWVGIISGDGKTLEKSTWFGTSGYDQIFFVDVDRLGHVYVNGQTSGGMKPIRVTYPDSSSGQFIAALGPNLDTLYWRGLYGSQSGTSDLSPSAFMVDACGFLYLSGWTGKINVNPRVPGPVNLPMYRSLQDSSDGFDFYLASFAPRMDRLVFGSYYGGAESEEHVDGGTSRFDKDGVMYQSICGGCGGNSDMLTTKGSVSQRNRSSNCNNAALEIYFGLNLQVKADFSIESDNNFCAGRPIRIVNKSTPVLRTRYFWSTSDGQVSNAFEPNFDFSKAGKYRIRLVANLPPSCNGFDTLEQEFTVFGLPSFQIQIDQSACKCLEDSPRLIVSNSYPKIEWSGPMSGTGPVLYPQLSGQYWVSVSDSVGCNSRDSVEIEIKSCQDTSSNVFSPNGDGKNDVFKPRWSVNLSQPYEWTVLDRWGNKVFETNDPLVSWNGKRFNSGDEMPSGNYFLLSKLTLCGETRVLHGLVMLLR